MSYALDAGNVDGQTFLERIEGTYVEFRRAIDLMVLNNSCQCNACANVSTLDLKFFVHHGSFAIQPVGDVQQLVGSDINLVHRLLKNTVTADTGIRAYLLATEPALEALGMDPSEDGMVLHEETPADFEATTVWIKDMHPAYEEAKQEERAFFDPDDVFEVVEVDLPIPRERVWHYANQSELRNLFIGSDRYDVLDRTGERVAAGSTYQCYHGKMILPQVVLDWRPFDRVVLRQSIPLPGKPHTIVEYRFSEVEGGTRFTQTVTKPAGPLIPRTIARMVLRKRFDLARTAAETFRDKAVDAYSHESHSDHGPPQLDRSVIQTAAAASLAAEA